MRIIIFIALYSVLVLFTACSTKSHPAELSSEKSAVFPVTDFLRGQLSLLDSMPVTPLKTTTQNNHTDSAWLTRDSIRRFAAPFLQPNIDSSFLAQNFSVHNFLDQTINAFTFTYDALPTAPADMTLRHIDIYVSPESRNVMRLYMVKEKIIDGKPQTLQLTWKVNSWCSIRAITHSIDGKENIKEDKFTWEFD